MISLISEKLTDTAFLMSLLAAVAAAATVLTLAMPLLEGDTLNRRMKSVALERDKIRERERERLKQGNQPSLRHAPKEYMKQTVDRFNLQKWLGTETAKITLAQAGYRGPQAEVTFLFFRLMVPAVLFLLAVVYFFLIEDFGKPVMFRIGFCVAALYIGIKLPEIFLSNQTNKRRLSMRRAFPDSLDLLLICVEAGMSIEHAFRKVSFEITTQSVALAEELTLTTAELSYLQERRVAYENLASRTGLESVKSICTALVQAERYGTPLGTALRVLAQESRDQRMNEAEKKAAALPPKLTVPMIIFFLPVLFVVILTPALIGVFKWS
jgi:tight adherence protein C